MKRIFLCVCILVFSFGALLGLSACGKDKVSKIVLKDSSGVLLETIEVGTAFSIDNFKVFAILEDSTEKEIVKSDFKVTKEPDFASAGETEIVFVYDKTEYKYVIKVFPKAKFAIEFDGISNTTNGRVVADKATAEKGEEVKLTVTADKGYLLKTDGIRMNGIVVKDNTFKMPNGKAIITAEFDGITRNLSIDKNITNGSIEVRKTSGIIGELIYINVFPESGYKMVEGSLKANNVAIPNLMYTISTEDVLFTCQFELKSQGVNINPTANGVITTDKETYTMGETVTLIITANDGYRLKSGSLILNNEGIEIELSGNTFTMQLHSVLISAEFELIPREITINQVNNLIIVADKTTALEGEEITLTITLENGYKIKDGTLKMNGVMIENNKFITPRADVVISAEIEKISYSISITLADNVVVTSIASSVWDEEISLNINATAGYKIKDGTLMANDIVVDNNKFIMPKENVTIVYEVEKAFYSVTVTNENGTILPSKSSAIMGEEITLKVFANPGYEYKNNTLKANGVAVVNNKFIMKTENAIITATFDKLSDTTSGLNYSSINENGTVVAYELASCTNASNRANLVVPNTHNSKPVLRINDNVFGANGNSYIKKIVLPSNLQTFNTAIFDKVAKLERIEVVAGNAKYSSDFYGVLYNKEKTQIIKMPKIFSGDFESADSVTEILQGAFSNTSHLNSVKLENVTKINAEAFLNSGINQIFFGDSLTEIGESAFKNCVNIQLITIPSTVKTLANNLFDGCKNLSSVTSDGVEHIGNYVFANTEKIIAYSFPSLVVEVGKGMFLNSIGLKAVEFNNLTKISNEMLRGAGADALTISANIVFIGSDAFKDMVNLKTVDIIGQSLINLTGTEIFNYNRLIMVDATLLDQYKSANSGNNNFIIARGNIVDGFGYQVVNGNAEIVTYIGSSDNVSVPNSLDGYTVTSIGAYAFALKSNIKTIVLPNSVSVIKEHSFNGCSMLASINMPSELEELGRYSFTNCASLANIILPNKTIKIGSFAINNCSNLTYLYLPSSVQYIEANAIINCPKLTIHTEVATDKNNWAIGWKQSSISVHYNCTMQDEA